MDTTEIPNFEAASSNLVSATRRNAAIQAYSRASIAGRSHGGYLKQATVDAISRWLDSDNVRIEFYLCKDKGEIRARIITDDKIDLGRDLSLFEFFSLNPAGL